MMGLLQTFSNYLRDQWQGWWKQWGSGMLGMGVNAGGWFGVILMVAGVLAVIIGVAALVRFDQTVAANAVADGQHHHQQPDRECRCRKTTCGHVR